MKKTGKKKERGNAREKEQRKVFLGSGSKQN